MFENLDNDGLPTFTVGSFTVTKDIWHPWFLSFPVPSLLLPLCARVSTATAGHIGVQFLPFAV